MPSQNETKDLIINKLTKEQYKTITDSNTNNEVYHIIDDAHYTEAEIEELLSTKQNTLTSSNAGNGISIENGVISNTQTSAEWGNIQGEITSQSDLQTALDNKANDNEVVHLANAETITGVKTFTGAVHLIGSGDSNAVGISTNTRFNVDGTNKTVLGFGSGIFYINHGDYRLRLRGKDTRPHYNSDSNYLALLSDIPDTSSFITMEDVEAKNYLTEVPEEYVTDTELSTYAYDKATVDDKIDEAVADLSGYAKDGEVVHLANSETITGSKTFTQPLKIQNGAGTGSLLIGGDVNAGTLTNGTRKLARIAVPTQTNKDLMATLLGFDSNGDDALHIKNKNYDAISFGGQTKITNATSPMSLGFCVTKTRNSTSASDKIYTLEMDSTEARFNVQPNYNGINLATTVDVTNALNSYAKLTDIPDTSNLATKTELTEGLATKQPTGNYIVNNAEEEEGIALGTNSSSLGYSAISIGENSFAHAYGIGIGYNAGASMIGAISIGENSKVIGTHGIAIGAGAYANSNNAIQIGTGTNDTENSLQVDNYTLLDLSTGLIPDERLSNNIAKTTDIPDISNLASKDEIPDTSSFITMPDVEAEGYLKGVQINDADLEISSDKKVNIPLASTNTLGVAKANAAYGVYANGGTLTISKATDAQVTAKTSQYRPIVPYNIDLAVKTGITTNTIELTDEEKSKAKEWLGISSGGGKDLFDVVLKDHLLSYEETLGYAQLGTYVYKTAKLNEYYGYPSFYEKCIEEYNNATLESEFCCNNITVVGSPIIQNDIISGFNSVSYGKVPEVPSDVSNYEIVVKFTTGALDGVQKGILANSTTNIACPQIIVDTSNKLFLAHSATSKAWATAGGLDLSENTTYWAKLKWDGSTVYGYYKLNKNDEWTLVGSVSSNSIYWTEVQGIGIDQTTYPFDGSIELGECYIDINGERFWTGATRYNVNKNKNGHSFYNINDVKNKNIVDLAYEKNGIAWHYGIDEINERIFLPRCDYIELTKKDKIPVAGHGLVLGLTNGTSKYGLGLQPQDWGGVKSCTVSGVTIGRDASTTAAGNNTRLQDCVGVCEDARLSGIEGKLDTLDCNNKYYYMVVGNTKTDTSWMDVIQQTNDGVKDLEDKKIASLEELENKRIEGLGSLEQKIDEAVGVAIGTYLDISSNETYTPFGYLLRDGAEYSKAQYKNFYNNWLTNGISNIDEEWTNSIVIGDGSVNFSRVYYLNDKYIAITDSNATSSWGYISYSYDGINWAEPFRISEDPKNYWYGLAYGNGVYVLAGLQGYVSTSTDGITWTTPVVVGDGNSWYDISFGNGRFVIVGADGYIASSTDGITWDTPLAYSSTYRYDIVFGNGIFVTKYANNQIMTSVFASTNNINNWKISATLEHDIDYLYYANGKFFAIYKGTTAISPPQLNSYISISEDGINWTTTAIYPTNVPKNICYGNGVYFARVGDSLATSTDGINYTAVDNFSDKIPKSIAYGQNKFALLLDGTNVSLKTSYTKYNTSIPVCSYGEYISEVQQKGFCEKFAVDTVNEKFIVPLANPNNRVLVEKKLPTEADPTWYNLYNDGWCEQGGVGGDATATAKAYTIDLLISYLDENYSLSGNTIVGENTTGSLTMCVALRTKDYFKASLADDSSINKGTFSWSAKGYTNNIQENTTRPFVVVANGELNQSDMNWSEYQTSLQGKVDKNDMIPCITIIDWYESDTEGYVVYSNNYCEQWGKVGRTAVSQAITLFKPYRDVNYGIQLQAYHTALSTDGRPPLVYNAETSKDSFTINLYTGYAGAYWRTYGFVQS